MKKEQPWALACFAVVAAAILLVGCDTESASSPIHITPSETTIRYNQSITFTASGGSEYTWDLEHESWGTLSSRRGESVVYTSLVQPETNAAIAVQVLTVSSALPNSGTNAAASAASGEAIIKHMR